MEMPRRPVLRWHGGKWLLAPWIISHFPPHRVYVEPYGGAASVLLRKAPSYAEIYGDLDDELVNLFRVLRDPARATKLVALLRLTPFAREEFYAAYGAARNRVERARRLIVRSFMGYGSDGASGQYRTGFRANSNRSGTTPAGDWPNIPENLERIVSRLVGVTIESRPAIDIMGDHDAPDALHYVDPPYLHETRARANRRADNGGVYRHEMTTEQHVELLDVLRTLQGHVIVSGYPSALYDERLQGWERIERAALADGAKPRTECLWLSPSVSAAMPSPSLFSERAA